MQRLGVRYPVVAAPMFLVSNALLLEAVGRAGAIGAVPSLNFRAHEQFRWFAFSCLLVPVLVFISHGTRFIVVAFALGYAAVAVAVAIGIAVLKYRLYDLDVVIKKTVVFAILVVLSMAA